MDTFLQISILWLATCASSLSAQSRINISVRKGSSAVLPCNWTNINTKQSSSQRPHIEWRTISETVFERQGGESYQGEGYENRVDVPEDKLLTGDCSLVLKDIRLDDEGLYESYLLVARKKRSLSSRWVFIQSIELSVEDTIEEKNVQDRNPAKEKSERHEMLKQDVSRNAGMIHTHSPIMAFTFLLNTLLRII